MSTANLTTTNLPLNNWQNDYTTLDGVRISTPTYLDLNQQQRKLLYSAVRSSIEAHRNSSTPRTVSGITVETAAGGSDSIESYLGITVENLRSVLFSRGGVDITLLLRLQLATGLEVVPVAELEKAYKARIALVKSYVKDNQFNG
jgi:hypothetical protein